MFIKIKKILIVDDSPDFRMLFRAVLSRTKLEILEARDGLEAVEILEKNTVDLVLTDFRMPRMNGVELLHWCRSREIFFPVIFTTADSTLFEAEQIALGDCCATFLKKPIDMRLFFKALEAADRFDHHEECMHSTFDKDLQSILKNEISCI